MTSLFTRTVHKRAQGAPYGAGKVGIFVTFEAVPSDKIADHAWSKRIAFQTEVDNLCRQALRYKRSSK